MKNISRVFSALLSAIVVLSCSNEEFMSFSKESSYPMITRSVVPEEFDWEEADWMPTPPGQAMIPMPWGGQGSISGFYGLEIVNDYLKKDGWRLVYSTFRNYGEELVDPYFVMYNVYRGTLRVYFFLTNPYMGESTYLHDVLTLNKSNGATSNILNYLGSEIINMKSNTTSFGQIQPKMLNGSAPLASRRWYMVEYEMAYDPNITRQESNNISLNWSLNYYNIDSISFDGNIVGEIYGTVGGSNNFINEAKSTIGKGVLSIAGLGTLERLTINEETGENKIGLDRTAFKSIVTGVKNAMSASASELPDLAVHFINSIFGGKSESSTKIVSLKSNSSISLKGASASHGAVSSTPIDFKIPGTIISSGSSGYTPLYNEPLGVVFWQGGVTVNINETISTTNEPDDIMGSGNYVVKHHYASDVQQDYSKYVIINPALLKIANVSILSQTVYALTSDSILLEFPLRGTMYGNPWESDAPIPNVDKVCIQLLLEVKPKDGAPATYISKTFCADNYNWKTKNIN